MAQSVVFRLHRLSDDLAYDFLKESGAGKDAIYVRSDDLVRIEFDAKIGWSIWLQQDEPGGKYLAGRVWDILPEDQGDSPTEGIWVSRKGAKSYVYKLKWVDEDK